MKPNELSAYRAKLDQDWATTVEQVAPIGSTEEQREALRSLAMFLQNARPGELRGIGDQQCAIILHLACLAYREATMRGLDRAVEDGTGICAEREP